MWSSSPITGWGAGRPVRPWVSARRWSTAIERRRPSVTVCQELAHLPGVQQAGPPVETGPPDGEGPAEDLREGGEHAVPVPEEQERERVEQVGRRGLAQEVDRQGAVATGPQERHQAPQEGIAGGQQGGHPPRDDPPGSEPDDRGEDVEPVRD